MHFFIATAALLCAAALSAATPIGVAVRQAPGTVTCEIIGNSDVNVWECASLECDVVFDDDADEVVYSPGDEVEFYCYLGGQAITNEVDAISSVWWAYSDDGFFPEAYVDADCAETIEDLCKIDLD